MHTIQRITCTNVGTLNKECVNKGCTWRDADALANKQVHPLNPSECTFLCVRTTHREKRVSKPHRAGRGKNIACSNVCLLPLWSDSAAGPHRNIAHSLVIRHNSSNICPNDGV
ncbi:hypothetical protein EVAR_15127_1 [Eumeta japonica]|uniref:Uncharacterized protein n=1 Tax=Eumeta variegata TaxID=151549 RepID=A0A4C1UHZ9_EUMVA|nr:hypothetical protein EVAR_15127_1 [Eumeta japonica]